MLTITEALAELNTIQKRVEKKREHVGGFLSRPDGIKDPLEKSGGSVEAIKREMQAIDDLNKRHLAIRMAIQRSNHGTRIQIGDLSMSVAEWLTWRKETAPGAQRFLTQLRQNLDRIRQQAQKAGSAVVAATGTPEKPTDIVVNIDEAKLAHDLEAFEEVLGTLDGKLSLINATTTIDI